eukprot:gene7966-12432_t
MEDEAQPLQHLIVESEGNSYVLENVSLQKRGGSYLSHWKINKKQPFQFTNLDASSFQTTTTTTNKKSGSEKPPRKKNEKKEVTFELTNQDNSPQFRKKRSIIDTHDPHQNLSEKMKVQKSMSIPALFPENSKDFSMEKLEKAYQQSSEEIINQDPLQNERRTRRKMSKQENSINFSTDKRYSVPSVYNFNQFREIIDDSASDGSSTLKSPQPQTFQFGTSSQNSSQSSQNNSTMKMNEINFHRRYSLKNVENFKKQQNINYVPPPHMTTKKGGSPPSNYNFSTRKSVSGPTTTVYMQESLNSYQSPQPQQIQPQTQQKKRTSSKRNNAGGNQLVYQFENYSIEKESKKSEIKRGDASHFGGQNNLEKYSIEKKSRGTGVSTILSDFCFTPPNQSQNEKNLSPRAKLSIKDVLN